MISALFKREMKSGYKLLLIFMGVLTMYVSMIIAMFDPKLGDSLTMFSKSMPELFAAFGMAGVGSTMLEFVANYLYGFLLIAFPIVFIILMSSRLMARYIDRGSMAYLLASPHKRRNIALTQIASMVVNLLLLVSFVTVLGISISQLMFAGELDIPRYIMLNICWLGLLLFLGSVCFCSASIFTETKYSLGVGGGVCIAFILIQMLSQAGDKFSALKYVTPLSLFAPKEIVAGNEQYMWYCLALAVASIVFFGIGAAVFEKRDLSL